MGRHAKRGQRLKMIRVLAAHCFSNLEAIHEQRMTALSIMLEQVKELQTHRVRKVCGIGVCADGQVRVGRVAVRHIGLHVPEATVMRFADKGDATCKFLRVLQVHWHAINEAVSVDVLINGERGRIRST